MNYPLSIFTLILMVESKEKAVTKGDDAKMDMVVEIQFKILGMRGIPSLYLLKNIDES